MFSGGKKFELRGASSFPCKLIPIDKGGENENDIVPSLKCTDLS